MITLSNKDYKTLIDIKNAYPSSMYIVAVIGGWAVFEYMSDYHTWLNQI